MGKIESANPYRMEACVVSLSQALQAQQSGADRIEICAHLETGGMTPDLNLVLELYNQLTIPIRVMIRETEDGFEADESVLEKMLQAIDEFKEIPIDGFVIGVMKNNRVDKEAIKRIVKHCFPFPITFHKALDESCELFEDVLWINAFRQIDTILTSGAAIKAGDGAEKILAMKSIFNGDIMGGGKILPHQLKSLDELLGLSWYHGRGIVGELGK
ncbi:MAG: copper homeostasis protein CutC [Saprospiraceae bacterium]